MARKKREMISPDLTPLIDVVFLILIFFMVSTTLKKDERALSLILPSGTSTQKIEKREINIELTKDELAMDGKKMRFDDLKKRLSTIKEKDKVINIMIDKRVIYERVMKLLDSLSEYGFNNINLVEKRK